ncbi:uncharacterized protein TRIADDRAFT_5809, partial [Trichoplax adhaerens]
ELQSNLSTYQAQLQQVEAALKADEGNEELMKLQHDLNEVINLTVDLIKLNTKGEVSTHADAVVGTSWKVGDKCQAVWSNDGLYYDADIIEISENQSTCVVTFTEYGNTETVKLNSLRHESEGVKRPISDVLSETKPESSRAKKEKFKDYKRKKALKKQQKLKDLEKERETEKSKWQQFSNKVITYIGSKKGLLKRSIFASPDSVTGKVGVGTCGISGQPMTTY